MGEVAESEGIGLSVEWKNTQQLAKNLIHLRETTVQLNSTSVRERKRLLEALNPLLK